MALITEQDLLDSYDVTGTPVSMNPEAMPPATLSQPLGQPVAEPLIGPSSNIPEEPQTFGEKVLGAFGTSNVINNVIRKNVLNPDSPFVRNEPVEGYSAYRDADLRGYEDILGDFARDRSPLDTEMRKADHDALVDSQESVSKGGLTSVLLTGAASALDITSLIPASSLVKYGSTAFDTAKIFKGSRTLRGAASGAAVGVTAIAPQEALLQELQYNRPAAESAINIMFGAAAGSILGGIGSKFLTREAAKYRTAPEVSSKVVAEMTGFDIPKYSTTSTRTLYEDLKADLSMAAQSKEPNFKISGEGLDKKFVLDEVRPYEGSMGAAAASKFSDYEYGRLSDQVLRWSTGPEFMRPVHVRAALSPFSSVNQFGDIFYRSSLTKVGHLEGRTSGTPIEVLMKREHNDIAGMIKKVDELYKEYAGINKNMGVIADAQIITKKFTDKSKMPFDEFRRQISYYLERGLEAPDPHVRAAVKVLGESLDKRLGELINEGLLEKGLKNYFPRVYRPDLKTAEMRSSFLRDVSDYFLKKNAGREVSGEGFEEGKKVLYDSERAYDDALKYYNRVTGIADDQMDIDMIGQKLMGASPENAFKGRTADVPIDILEPYLVRDPLMVIPQYLARSQKVLQLNSLFKRMGVKDYGELKTRITEEFEQAAAKDPARRVELGLARDKDLKLIDDQLKTFTQGTHESLPFKVLKTYQIETMLGNMLINSLGDVSNSIGEHGWWSFARDGLGEVFFNHKYLSKFTDELKDMNFALEEEMGATLVSLMSPDKQIVESGFSKALDVSLGLFSKVSFMSTWNASWKRVAARMSMSRTARTIGLGANAAEKDAVRLARLGISKKHQAIIRAQINKHQPKDAPDFYLNMKAWDATDEVDEARRALENSIFIDADTAGVLTPTAGEMPAGYQQSEWVKLLLRFRTFSYSSTTNILLRAMDRRDAFALQGLITAQVLGMISGSIYRKLKDKEPYDNAREALMDGFVRSGAGGILGDYGMGTLNSLYGGVSGRYINHGVSNALLGPGITGAINTIDTIGHFGRVIGNELTDGKLAPETEFNPDNDVEKLRKMLPFANIFWYSEASKKAFGNIFGAE